MITWRKTVKDLKKMISISSSTGKWRIKQCEPKSPRGFPIPEKEIWTESRKSFLSAFAGHTGLLTPSKIPGLETVYVGWKDLEYVTHVYEVVCNSETWVHVHDNVFLERAGPGSLLYHDVPNIISRIPHFGAYIIGHIKGSHNGLYICEGLYNNEEGPTIPPAKENEPNLKELPEFRWVPSSDGAVPPNAVRGGHNNGEPMYVARANHVGALTPGKLIPNKGAAYISWGGFEHAKSDYEVLCDCSCSWVPSSDGMVPEGAVYGGQTEHGEPLFIGRVAYKNTVTVGKVNSSESVLYIPYEGLELAFSDYEVLVED